MPFRAPDLDHPLFGPFWREAPDGLLRLPQCSACSTVLWPPSEVCASCLASAIEWRELPGDGEVWGVAEYHRGYSAALAEEVPYQCVLVELDCGPRIIARFDGESLAVPGSRVRVSRMQSGDVSVPCFAAAVHR